MARLKHELPEVAFEHGSTWVEKGNGGCRTRKSPAPISRRGGAKSGAPLLFFFASPASSRRLHKALADLDLGIVGDAHDKAVLLHVGDLP
jgi:hypothetical protein